MQNHFCLNIAVVTIRSLVLATPSAVDFEAGDWQENCAGHISVGLIKGRSKADLPSNLRVGIVLAWVPSHAKLRDTVGNSLIPEQEVSPLVETTTYSTSSIIEMIIVEVLELHQNPSAYHGTVFL
ncbi:hypothetical protein TNCV_4740691 [Trichonephila clavipes]|nr:hypothetical protein TNCV_4740691 [Trichonephila clavipes]